MNKRLLVVVGGFIIVLFGLSLLFFRGQAQNWPSSTRVPGDFSTAAPYGQNTIVFSNGRAFVSYDYTNGQSHLISADSITPYLDNIDQLYASSNKQYLVFHMTIADAGSVLYSDAQQAGINPNQPSWWIYNVAKSSFQSLPQNTATVRIMNNTLYALSSDTEQTLTLYDIATLQQQASYQVPSSSNFYPIAGGIILETEDNRVLSSKNYVTYNQLFSAANILNVNPNGLSAIATRVDSSGTDQLMLLNFQGRTYKVIDSGINSQTASTVQNDVVYTKGTLPNLVMYSYNATTQKVSSVKFGSKTLSNNFTLTPKVLLSAQTGLFEDTANIWYIAGKNIAAVPVVSDSYSKTITEDGHPLALVYYPGQNAFIITLDAASAQQERNAVYAQLRSDGFDPNLLNIRMHLFTQIHGVQ